MKQKSLKNTIRNIALVVLTLLMGVMTLLSGIFAMGSEKLLHSFRQSLGHAVTGYEVRTGDSPAAYPSAIAMTGADGQLYGAAYNERAVAQLFETTRELLGGALTAAGTFEPFTEEQLRQLLASETLCYAYNGEIPAAALAAWFEGRSDSDWNISMLLLTRSGDLVLRTREQGLVHAASSVDRSGWTRAAAQLGTGSCVYAGTSEKPVYRSLAAETLLFEDTGLSASVLISEPPVFGDPTGADSLQTLLGAFGYSVYVRSYQERDAQVYVDNDSTMRVCTDGEVRYSAARQEDEDEGEPIAMTAAIEQARVILEQAQYSIGAGTQTELLSALTQEDGRKTLLFGLVFEGIPVVTGEPYAQFEFVDAQLVRAVIHLRRCTATEERQYILPAAQTAAASPRQDQRMGIAYVQREENTFTAERCFTFVETPSGKGALGAKQ